MVRNLLSTGITFVLILNCIASSTSSTVVNSPSELQSKLDQAKPGDIIDLGPYTFSGTFTASQSGTESQPITLLTNSQNVVLQGSGSGVGLTVTGNYWNLKYFAVRNYDIGVLIRGAGCKVEALAISNVNKGIVVKESVEKTQLSSNAINGVKLVGIELGQSSKQTVLSTNTVEGGNSGALEAGFGSSGSLSDNVFFGEMRMKGAEFSDSGNVYESRKKGNTGGLATHVKEEVQGFWGEIASWFSWIG